MTDFPSIHIKQPETRGEILSKAQSLVTGDRHQVYGDPEANMRVAAQLKNVTRSVGCKELPNAQRECLDMVLTKISRIVTAPEPHLDNYVDLAGYAAILGELAMRGSE